MCLFFFSCFFSHSFSHSPTFSLFLTLTHTFSLFVNAVVIFMHVRWLPTPQLKRLVSYISLRANRIRIHLLGQPFECELKLNYEHCVTYTHIFIHHSHGQYCHVQNSFSLSLSHCFPYTHFQTHTKIWSGLFCLCSISRKWIWVRPHNTK